MKAAGGGVVDIASLALRVAIWSIGKTDNVLVLDEPIKNIQPALLQMEAWDIIQKLSQQLNLQFIIITNSTNNGEALTYDDETKVFTVTKELENINNNSFGVSRIKGEEL
jgi:ABC-type sugar transport system ATPase subunit